MRMASQPTLEQLPTASYYRKVGVGVATKIAGNSRTGVFVSTATMPTYRLRTSDALEIMPKPSMTARSEDHSASRQEFYRGSAMLVAFALVATLSWITAREIAAPAAAFLLAAALFFYIRWLERFESERRKR